MQATIKNEKRNLYHTFQNVVNEILFYIAICKIDYRCESNPKLICYYPHFDLQTANANRKYTLIFTPMCKCLFHDDTSIIEAQLNKMFYYNPIKA